MKLSVSQEYIPNILGVLAIRSFHALNFTNKDGIIIMFKRADVEVHFMTLIFENWPSFLLLLPMLRQALTIVLGFARSDLTKRALIRNAVVTCWNKLDAHLKRPHKDRVCLLLRTMNDKGVNFHCIYGIRNMDFRFANETLN